MVPKIERLAGGLEGKRVAVLGLAFKPETDDIREAPALDIIRGLLERGATVSAYDPVASSAVEKLLPQIEYAPDEYAAAMSAEVLVSRRVFVRGVLDRKSTRLNSSHANISYAVFCLKKKKMSY